MINNKYICMGCGKNFVKSKMSNGVYTFYMCKTCAKICSKNCGNHISRAENCPGLVNCVVLPNPCLDFENLASNWDNFVAVYK